MAFSQGYTGPPDDRMGSTPERSDGAPQTRYQFSMRILFLLPMAIALPIAVGELTNDLSWAVAAVLAEIVAAAIYPPTRILAALVILLFFSLLLLHPPGGASEYAYRSQCANNLNRIALALHNYHDAYKCFPPAYVADEEGRPMHSWRVLILPYMEQQALSRSPRYRRSCTHYSSVSLSKSSSTIRCGPRGAVPRLVRIFVLLAPQFRVPVPVQVCGPVPCNPGARSCSDPTPGHRWEPDSRPCD